MRSLLPLRLTLGAFLVHHAGWILLARRDQWDAILTAMGPGSAAVPAVAALEGAAGAAILLGAPARLAALAVAPWMATWALLGYLRLAGPTGWLTPTLALGALLTLAAVGPGEATVRTRLAAWDGRVIGERLRWARPFERWPLRLTASMVMLHQGLAKVVEHDLWLSIFTDLGFPAPHVLVPLVTFAEVAGALALLAGVLVRFSSAVFILIVTTAIATAWLPLPPGTGWDMDVLLIATFWTFLVAGPGRPTLESMAGTTLPDPERRLRAWWKQRSA